MVDLMDRQAFRIETSFMAATDKFSTELQMLFQDGTPVTPTHTQASGYGPHSQPKSWGQSQPTRVDPGPTCQAKTAHGPLHALAVSLGQSSPKYPTAQQIGPVRAITVRAHPGLGNVTAASVTHTHPGQTHSAYLKPPGSIVTAEPFDHVAQQIKPRSDAQQVQRPLPIRLELPPQDPCTKEIRRATEDGLAQGCPKTPSYFEPFPLGKPRTWRDLFPKAFWARCASKDSAMGTSPYVFAHGRDINKLMGLRVQPLRVFKQLGRKTKNYGLTVPQDVDNSERPWLDTYTSAQVQKEMAPRAYDKKIKKKKAGVGKQ
ncbi:unnamed protein product, partial [Prunus brigantina]